MVTVCTLASDSYVHFAKALTVSARINWPSVKMVVALVNAPTSAKEEFEKAHPNCQVFLQTCKKGKERAVCSNRKGALLQQVRNEGNKDTLMWVDADSLICRPCENLESMLNANMCVRLKKSITKIRGSLIRDCYSGVFSFGPSKQATAMLDEYKSYGDAGIYFGSDQDNLAYTYDRHSNKGLGELPSSLLDFEMLPDSFIWTLKCKPKEINARFMRQHREYLEQA